MIREDQAWRARSFTKVESIRIVRINVDPLQNHVRKKRNGRSVHLQYLIRPQSEEARDANWTKSVHADCRILVKSHRRNTIRAVVEGEADLDLSETNGI